MRIEGAYTLLIYPFRHAITDEAADPHLRALDRRWRHWWTRLPAKSLERALDDTYFFLPHIRKQLLFPEVLLLSNDPAVQVGEAEQLARVSASALAGLLAERGFRQSSVLRLTCDPSVREALHPLLLDPGADASGDAPPPFPLGIDWIDLILFPQHVGFLALKVRLDEPHPTADRLNDFLYFLRLVHRPTVGWRLPTWRRSEPPLAFEARDLVDFLLQDVAAEADAAADSLEEFLARVAGRDGPRRYSLTEQGQVYGQTFRQYSYGYVGDPSPDAAVDAAEGSAGVEPAGGPGLFASPTQRVLYELATCTQTADPDFAPHPRGLARTLAQSHIALWANWQAMALHDNVVFLGARASTFTRRTLPHNVEADYFHLYLLTLYQKIRLSFLSGELVRRDVDRVDDPREAGMLWDDYTRFRNHYWFVEVTSRPQGIALYRRFQRGLGVRGLHAAVGAEVRELREYYESRASTELAKRQESNIAIVAHVQSMVEYIEIFLVSVYTAHLTDMLFATPAETHPWGHLWVAMAAALGAIGTGWFVLREKAEFRAVLVLTLTAFVAVLPPVFAWKHFEWTASLGHPVLVPRWNYLTLVWGVLVAIGAVLFGVIVARLKAARRSPRRSRTP